MDPAPAARLHEHDSWNRNCKIPAYALMPDGTMAPTTIFAKLLPPIDNPNPSR